MHADSFSRPIPWYFLVLLALLLWGGEYMQRGLWAPDEARYALISREMRQDSHWLVPFRQGEFYTHKPPLMFWLTNTAVAAGLPERVAARVPSFFGALMSLWAITRLAARWFDARTSWWVALLLPTSFLFWNKGGFGQIDALLLGLEMMGLFLLFTSDPTKSARRIPAYLFFGLAMLAKGPVGLLVPMAVYAAASFVGNEGARTRGWHWIWGPLLALALPGLWLAAAWWQGAPDGFFQELLLKQNVGRVTGEFGGHLRPWYYFLLYFPLDFLPWSILLPLSALALLRRDDDPKDFRRLLAWIGTVILLFSFGASKRNLYILLAHPAAALLVAASIPNWSLVSSAFIRRSRALLLAFTGIVTVGLIATVFVPRAHMPWWAITPPSLALLAGIVFALRAARRFPTSPRWLAGLALAMFLAFASVGTLVYREFNADKTPDEIEAVAARVLPPGHYLICYKNQGEINALYANRPGRMADTKDELFALLAAQSENLIITDASRLEEVLALVGRNHPHGLVKTGSKTDVWIELQP